MKRILGMLLVLVLLLGTTAASAAGKLRVTQENFYPIDSYTKSVHAFARVDNVGDRPIKVNAGILEVFNKAGDAITSTDYMNANAEYLQPEEYTYVKLRATIEDGGIDQVDDFMLTITGKSQSGKTILRFPCTTDWEPNAKIGYFTRNNMYATYTNNTDDVVYGISVVLALLDDQGNILFLDDDSLYSERGLMPGSSLTIRKDVDGSFMEMLEKQGIVPTKVDAIAYVTMDDN